MKHLLASLIVVWAFDPNASAQGITSGMLPVMPERVSRFEISSAYGEFEDSMSYSSLAMGYFGYSESFQQVFGVDGGWTIGGGIQELRQEGIDLGSLFNYEGSAGVCIFRELVDPDGATWRFFLRTGLTVGTVSNSLFLSDVFNEESDKAPGISVTDFYGSIGGGVVCRFPDGISLSSELGFSRCIDGGFAGKGDDLDHWLLRTGIVFPLEEIMPMAWVSMGLSLGSCNSVNQREIFIRLGLGF